MGTVDLDFARNGFVFLFVGKRFADFMSQNESRLVLAIKIARELQCAMPFRAVHKDRDGQKIGADRKLAAGEDGAGRDAELMRARLAFPKLARLIFIGGAALAARANWLAFGIGPAQRISRKASSASLSDMRATFARLSECAAGERRKC
jgi:hypothetical protein